MGAREDIRYSCVPVFLCSFLELSYLKSPGDVNNRAGRIRRGGK